MPRTAIIIQARMTSTRLPGKSLMELGGMTVLAQVLRRCAAIDGVATVCCAIPTSVAHNALADEAETQGSIVVRGPEDDVLGRYALAARQIRADVVMRVTADCPLIDPELCTRVLSSVTAGEADYACNNMPPSWPHGLDCEAFTRDLLERAVVAATDPYEREHVTPWMRSAVGIRHSNVLNESGRGNDERWTLDFPEDFDFLRRLFALLPPAPAIPSTADILDIVDQNPQIALLNRAHRGKSRPTGTAVP